jgi:hypothetical protein
MLWERKIWSEDMKVSSQDCAVPPPIRVSKYLTSHCCTVRAVAAAAAEEDRLRKLKAELNVRCFCVDLFGGSSTEAPRN